MSLKPPMSDFAKYLDGLPLGHAGDIASDEESGEELPAWKMGSDGSAQGASPACTRGSGVTPPGLSTRRRPAKTLGATQGKDMAPRRVANTDRKRAEKLEDAAWIEAQLAPDGGDACRASSRSDAVDVLEWRLNVDGENTPPTPMRGMLSAETASSLAAQVAVEAPQARCNPLFCISRIWAGGWGAQCTVPRLLGSELCSAHEKQLRKQKYLTHGRYDGPIPPKKRLEMARCQALMLQREAQRGGNKVRKAMSPDAVPTLLTDGAGFCKTSWRAMARGATESDRAYKYRTGHQPADSKDYPSGATVRRAKPLRRQRPVACPQRPAKAHRRAVVRR